MEIIKTERNGKEFTIATTDKDAIEAIVDQFSFYVRTLWTNSDHDSVTVTCGNKSEAARVRAALEQPVVAPAAAPAEPKSNPTAKPARRAELVETAERDGLNRGKGWIASDYDVDRLSLNPCWVGQAICYVYE